MKSRFFPNVNKLYHEYYYKDNSKNLFLDLHIKPYYSYKDKLNIIIKLKKT